MSLILPKRALIRPWLSSHLRTPLYRSAYALMLSSALSSGLGILYWILAAHLYSSRVVGLNSAAISAMSFLSGVSLLSLSTGMIRFIPGAGRATSRFTLTAYLIGVTTGAVAGAAFVAGMPVWTPGLRSLGSSSVLYLGFILGTVSWSVFRLQDDVLAAVRRAEWVPIENGLYAGLKIVLLLLFAAPFTRLGIYASWTLPACALIVPINVLLFARLIPRHVERTESAADPIVVRHVVRLLAGDYLGSLFSLTSSTLLPIMVASISGATAAAYFYLPWVITISLMAVAINMATSLTVEGSADEARLLFLTNRAMVHMLRIFVPIVVVIAAAAQLILTVFGPAYAHAGTALLRVLALSTIPSAVVVLYLSVCQVRRRIGPLIGVQALLAAMILPSTWVLLPHFGILSVGVVWTSSQTLVATVLLAFPLRASLTRWRDTGSDDRSPPPQTGDSTV